MGRKGEGHKEEEREAGKGSRGSTITIAIERKALNEGLKRGMALIGTVKWEEGTDTSDA
jgi:hypothetical protein